MKKGFTLVEIIVVISVLMISGSLGIGSYNKFNRDRIAKKAADDLRLYLRKAASKAQNNEKDVSICNQAADTLNYWFFSFNPLSIYGSCGSKTFGLENISMPSDVTITRDPARNIRFYPPGHSSGLQTNIPAGGIVISVNSVEVLQIDPSANVK